MMQHTDAMHQGITYIDFSHPDVHCTEPSHSSCETITCCSGRQAVLKLVSHL